MVQVPLERGPGSGDGSRERKGGGRELERHIYERSFVELQGALSYQREQLKMHRNEQTYLRR